MADNVTANPGSGGAVFATDDISSIHYPRLKLTLGADGANDGDVSAANPLPVTAPSGIGLADVYAALKLIYNCLVRPMWANPATGKLVVDSGTLTTVSTVTTCSTVSTVTTCSTVTTVTGVTNLGGFAAAPLVFDSMRNNWAASVRRNIT